MFSSLEYWTPLPTPLSTIDDNARPLEAVTIRWEVRAGTQGWVQLPVWQYRTVLYGATGRIRAVQGNRGWSDDVPLPPKWFVDAADTFKEETQ